jgi:hypothetical protein
MNNKEREEREKNPPSELLAECEKVNKDFLREHIAHVEPYFADDEFGGEWKIMLIWEGGSVLHFCPGSVDSHGFYLMVSALQEVKKRSIQLGRAAAMYDQFCSMTRQVGVNPKEVVDIFNNHGRL